LSDSRPRVLIPIARPAEASGLLEVAGAILRGQGGSGHVLGVIELPPHLPIAEKVNVARDYRSLLSRITALRPRVEAGLGVQVRVAASLALGVREAAFENATDLIVLDWPGPRGGRPETGPGAESAEFVGWHNVEDLVASPPADLLLVRPAIASNGRQPGQGVLVPVRGGPSAELALRTATAIATARRLPLTVMHVYDPRHPPERREREARVFRELVGGLGRKARILEVEATQPSQAIADEGMRHAVVVLGAFAELNRSSVVVGSKLYATLYRTPGTVILAKSPRAVAPIAAPGMTATPVERGPDVSALVDRWIAENTFNSREFRDLKRLTELKRRQRLTISLALPTLNEAATIARILTVLKGALMDRQPLLDEVVVIDSGSTDGTPDIARSLGVPVHQHAEILPELGTFRGKGEALWKSLHVTRGDIVAWCDTDITNIHPQFVYGVVGPLLTDPRISYVKGFYRRPLKFGGKLHAAGGGRVTELVARPLINLFYPELSGLLQPLSGEYAGRREVLERLPFFTGYGIEIGHLIDLVETYGLNRIAQTDLGVRIHRNQELLDLSKMAFAIMQVALKRLGDRHRIHLMEEVNRSLKLIQYVDEHFSLEALEISDWERPAMASVAEYLYLRQPRLPD
jgi:glucosyl-3-phosphoglycerate synthase